MNPIEVYKRSNSQTSELTGVRRPVAPGKVSRVTSSDYSSGPRPVKSEGGDAVKVNFSSAARSYNDVSKKSESQTSLRPDVAPQERKSYTSIRAVA